MPGQKDSRPIVIKRRRVVAGDGHHGGAWKVAYADFVTAMMAFFLMLWLLGSTTDDQRKGLADYFSPTVPVHRVSGGGDGLYGGEAFTSGERLAGGTGSSDGEDRRDDGLADASDHMPRAALDEIADTLRDAIAAGIEHPEALAHLALQVTESGVLIEVFDLDDSPLFDPGSARPMPVMEMLGRVLGQALGPLPHPITLDGHVRAHAIVEREDHAWPLSVARPQAVHRMLEGAGVQPSRFLRLTGHGDRVPVTDNPLAPRNNRIALLLRTDKPAESR